MDQKPKITTTDNFGWIKLHRKIKNHWIFTDHRKFHAWVAMLIEVNHDTIDVLIGDMVFRCKAGESYKSLDTWTRIFGIGWSKSATRRFFTLLKKENMIVTENVKKTTHLTICNWETYQVLRSDDGTELARNWHANDT